YDAPADTFVADFIGEANLIDCTITAREGEDALVDIAGLSLRLPARGIATGPAKVAIRPSRVRLAASGGLAAEVTKATYVGARMEYSLTGAFGRVFAISDDVVRPLAAGTHVSIDLEASGLVLVPAGAT